MLERYRLALCNTVDPPGTQSTTTTQPGTATTQPAAPIPPPSAPAPGEEWRNMTGDQFKARIAEAQNAGGSKAFKDLGFKDAAEARAALDELKKLKDAQLSEQERTKKQIDELAPKAQRADELEQTVKALLEVEEKAIPDDKRGLLDLAPPATQPDKRLAWIASAKGKGLFASAPAAAASAASAPREPKPATTIAPPGPTAPQPAGTLTPKQQYLALKKTSPNAAAIFYRSNRAAIDADNS